MRYNVASPALAHRTVHWQARTPVTPPRSCTGECGHHAGCQPLAVHGARVPRVLFGLSKPHAGQHIPRAVHAIACMTEPAPVSTANAVNSKEQRLDSSTQATSPYHDVMQRLAAALIAYRGPASLEHALDDLKHLTSLISDVHQSLPQDSSQDASSTQQVTQLQHSLAHVVKVTCGNLALLPATYFPPSNLLQLLPKLQLFHRAASRLLWQCGASAKSLTDDAEEGMLVLVRMAPPTCLPETTDFSHLDDMMLSLPTGDSVRFYSALWQLVQPSLELWSVSEVVSAGPSFLTDMSAACVVRPVSGSDNSPPSGAHASATPAAPPMTLSAAGHGEAHPGATVGGSPAAPSTSAAFTVAGMGSTAGLCSDLEPGGQKLWRKVHWGLFAAAPAMLQRNHSAITAARRCASRAEGSQQGSELGAVETSTSHQQRCGSLSPPSSPSTVPYVGHLSMSVNHHASRDPSFGSQGFSEDEACSCRQGATQSEAATTPKQQLSRQQQEHAAWLAEGAACRTLLHAVGAFNRMCRARLQYQDCFVPSQGWVDALASTALETLTAAPCSTTSSSSSSSCCTSDEEAQRVMSQCSPADASQLLGVLAELLGGCAWVCPPSSLQALDHVMALHGPAAFGSAVAHGMEPTANQAGTVKGSESPLQALQKPPPVSTDSSSLCQYVWGSQAAQAPTEGVSSVSSADLGTAVALLSARCKLGGPACPPLLEFTVNVMDVVMREADACAMSAASAAAAALGLMPQPSPGSSFDHQSTQASAASQASSSTSGTAAPQGPVGSAALQAPISAAGAGCSGSSEAQHARGVLVLSALSMLLQLSIKQQSVLPSQQADPCADLPSPHIDQGMLLNKLFFCIATLPDSAWRDKAFLTRTYPQLLQVCVGQLQQRPEDLLTDSFVRSCCALMLAGQLRGVDELLAVAEAVQLVPDHHMLDVGWEEAFDAALVCSIDSVVTVGYMRDERWSNLLELLESCGWLLPRAAASLCASACAHPKLFAAILADVLRVVPVLCGTHHVMQQGTAAGRPPAVALMAQLHQSRKGGGSSRSGKSRPHTPGSVTTSSVPAQQGSRVNKASGHLPPDFDQLIALAYAQLS